MRIVPRPADEAGIAAAAAALARGELVLHPTETVVSLSGDPYDERAVARAMAIKEYATPRPVLCLVTGVEGARALAREWSREADLLASRFWPGPLTLVVPASREAPVPVTSAGTIALRPAADPVSRALLAAWRGPLFSTSANRRDSPAHSDVTKALRDLGSAPGGEAIGAALVPIVPAEAAGLPSTIVDATTGPVRIVREGAISADAIRAIVAALGADER